MAITITGHLTLTAIAAGADAPAAPVANFSAIPSTGTTPLSVSFLDTSTNTPTSWLWNFGDGNTSIVQSPTHIYSIAGTYTVSLRAYNDQTGGYRVMNDYIMVTK